MFSKTLLLIWDRDEKPNKTEDYEEVLCPVTYLQFIPAVPFRCINIFCLTMNLY